MRSSSSSSTQVYEKKQAPFNESACDGNKKRISMNVGGGGIVSWNIRVNNIKAVFKCKAFSTLFLIKTELIKVNSDL